MSGPFVRIAAAGHDPDAVARIDGHEYTHDDLRRALNDHSETFASSSPDAMFESGLPYGHRPSGEHLTTVNMVEFLVDEYGDDEIHDRLESVREAQA